MIRTTLAVAGKELLVLLKNRGTLAVLFLLPIVLSSVFSSMNLAMMGSPEGEEEAMTLPVVLVNQDGGAHGQQVEKILADIKALEVATVVSVEEANQRVVDGEALAAVVLPPDLSANVDAYQASKVQVLIDPTQEQYASLITGIMNQVLTPVVLQGEIQYGIRSAMDRSSQFEGIAPDLRRAIEAQTLGVIMTQLQKAQETPWIAVRREGLEGVEAKAPWNPIAFTMPGFTVMFAFFLVGVIAQTLWAEKEQGAFRRLLAAPMPRGAIIAGKMLAYMLVVCLQFTIFFALGNLAFGMPLGKSPLGLILLTLAVALTATGLGMLIAALSRNSRQADSLGMVLAFVLAALGGCLYPLFRMEGLIGLLSRLTPHAHAMIGYMNLFEGASLAQVLPQVGILAGFGVVFFLVAMWRFRFES